MKRILTSAFIALTLLVFCGKDDKNLDETNSLLIGVWHIQTKVVNGSLQNLSDCEKKETLVFTDKTINRIESEMKNGVCIPLGDDIAKYTISDNKIIEISEGEKEEFNFTITNNTLTMTLVEQDDNMTITTVTTYKKS
ncbi:lipocalin family protein [Capnocytophaga felis]|uniref:Lipocalin-like domain-containing protein n=1 Tax=Capnocytophaga felis TaxID=2267611 RepID=A0A5M4B9Z3_9FLAO|nr:lipocalin family protein [Capnocytophaga felis]GET46122.1 hypothetical protein RCZ01_14240 [Capnocytophaga felis]GET48914.1 hypothetical protein RCZ02_17450 [Capnocytophaga felis]